MKCKLLTALLLVCCLTAFGAVAAEKAPKEKGKKAKDEEKQSSKKKGGDKEKGADDGADGGVRMNGRRRITREPVLDSDKPDAEATRVYLPELEEDPGRGNFIYYDTPTFRFTASRTGSCVLKLKGDDGEFADKGTFELGSGMATSWRKPVDWDRYKNREICISVARHMVEVLSSDIKPTNKPSGKIFIRAKLMDKVEYQRVFNFAGNRVEVWSGFNCPNRDYPSEAGYSINFPTTKTFTPDIDMEARKEALKDWWLKFDSPNAKKGDYYFYENAKLPIKSKSMEVFGPWGPKRKFKIQAKDFTMQPEAYAGNCPHQGFKLHIARIGNGTASGSKYVGYMLTVD